jgi:O-antigen/teichoic acid export membrane protein
MTISDQRVAAGEKHSSSRMLRNSIFILASRGIQFLSSFFVIIIIARYLSVEQYGEYSFLFAFVSSVMALSYFGIQQVLIREIARNKKSASQSLGAAIQLRSSLSAVAVIIVLLALYFKNPSLLLVIACIVAIASEFFLSFSMLSKSVFQAFEKMIYEPMLTLIYCIVLSVSVAAVIYFDMGFLWLFIAAAFANLVQLVIASYILSSRFIRPSFTIERSVFRQFFKNAVVIGLGIFFYQNLFRIDVLMLKWFGRIEDVAFFQIPHSLILQIQQVPMSLVIAIFPVFSMLIHTDRETMASLYEKIFRFMFIGSMFACMSLFLFSKEIIHLVFGAKYAVSAIAMMIVSLAVVPLFMDMILNGVLIAMNKQKYSAIYAGIALILNALAAIVFIPQYGFIAAAWIAVFSYTFVFICSLYFVEKNGLSIKWGRVAAKTFTAVFISGTAVFMFKPFSIILSVIGGTILYFGILLLLRAFTMNELFVLKKIMPAPRI